LEAGPAGIVLNRTGREDPHASLLVLPHCAQLVHVVEYSKVKWTRLRWSFTLPSAAWQANGLTLVS